MTRLAPRTSLGVDRSGRPWTAFLGMLIEHRAVVIVLAVAMPYLWIVTALHSPAMSPIDEWVYIDYVSKVFEQGIVREGEYIGSFGLSLMSCHGVIPYGVMGSACGLIPTHAEFPYAGVSSGAAYTPLAFVVIRAVGGVLGLLPGVDALLAWRLVGSLWFAAGIIMISLVARRLGVGRLPFIAGALALTASPLTWWTFTYLSTDAPMLFFGALLLFLVLRFVEGEGSGWWIVAVAPIAAAFKVIAVLALGLVAILALVVFVVRLRARPIEQGSAAAAGRSAAPTGARLLIPPVVAVLAGLVVPLLWTRLAPLWAVSDARVDHGISTQLTLEAFLQQFTSFLQFTLAFSVNFEGIRQYLYTPLAWLGIVGVIGGVFVLRRGDRDLGFRIATALAVVLAAPVMSLAFQVVTGSYFDMPARYGIPLLGAIIVAAMLIMRNRVVPWIVVLYSGALIAYGVVLAWQLRYWFP